MINYLEKLKEKCQLEDNFIDIINQIFDKLISFGYITNKQVKKLEKKLYDNIDTVFLGQDIAVDYKTGYYDSVKKELYIKDIHNLESVYLRIIYILTTTELDNDLYSVGYSTVALTTGDSKIIHRNFGFNRAIVSNLVCRLLYTLPTTLSIVPTYRTYQNNFLGQTIHSDNDIYFLEGKLLSQICYILNLDEEELYINLFIKPHKFIKKFFAKAKFEHVDEILHQIDSISRKYSNYNKLVYYNQLLDTNYINIKKNILNGSVEEYEQEQIKIKSAIKKALFALSSPQNEKDEEEVEFNIEASMSEKMNNLELEILDSISQVQNTLVDSLIQNDEHYSSIQYAIKLKELNKMCVIPNNKLKDAIYETILHKLLNTQENTASNLIEKIKFSIVNEILSSDKYIKIYNNMMFRKLNGLPLPDNISLVAITIEGTFMQLIQVDSLNLTMKKLQKNTTTIYLDNLNYLLNNPESRKDISKIEQIYTNVRNKYGEFNSTRIDKMYLGSVFGNLILLIAGDNEFNMIHITEVDGKINSKIIKLSEPYSIFNLKNTSTLPSVYQKKESPIRKLFSLFSLY